RVARLFFFQAEDGIRDRTVTGVQTCALPISCFFDGAKLTRLSPLDSPVFALQRVSVDGKDAVLVLVNTDVEKSQPLSVSLSDGPAGCPRPVAEEGAVRTPRPTLSSFEDLLGQPTPKAKLADDGKIQFALK